MELKKSKEADIERLKTPIRFMGLLFVGGLALATFSFGIPSEDDSKGAVAQNQGDINYETQVEEPPEPEDTPPPAVVVPPEPTEDSQEEENKPEPPVANITPPNPPAPPGPKTQPKKVDVPIIDFPDVEASFPGGAAAMQAFINENVEYPQTSIEMNEQGRVYLSFVVEPDGKITNLKVERGVSSDLDKEAKRVVRKMPNWVPGEAAGKKARTRCRLPISFTLN